MGSLAGWWYAHDPFRGVDRYAIYDSTAYYKPARGAFETPRRQRTLFLKGADMKRVLEEAQRAYPAAEGWTWHTDNMPESFLANRRSPNDRIPESVAAGTTVENTIQLTEFVKVPRSEEQVVLRTRGSEAFVPYPFVRQTRPSAGGNDGGDRSSFGMRFLNAG